MLQRGPRSLYRLFPRLSLERSRFYCFCPHKDFFQSHFTIYDESSCYRITKEQVLALEQGESILASFGGSHERALTKLFPEYNVSPWKFSHSQEFWKKGNNQQLFLLWVQYALQLPTHSIAEWDNVTNEQIEELGGTEILKLHNMHLWKALYENFPNSQSQFLQHWQKVHTGDWERVQFIIKHIQRRENIDTPLQWALLPKEKRRSLIGDLIDAHGGVVSLFSSIYPHIDWHGLFVSSRFDKSITERPGEKYEKEEKLFRFWNHQSRLRDFIDSLRVSCSIMSPKQWKNISKRKIRSVQGGDEALARHEGSLVAVLRSAYPNYEEHDAVPFSKLLSCPLYLKMILEEMRKKECIQPSTESTHPPPTHPPSIYPLSVEDLSKKRNSWFVLNHPLGHALVAYGGRKLVPLFYPDHFEGIKGREKIPLPCTSPPSSSYPLWCPSVDPTGYWMTGLPKGKIVVWNGKEVRGRGGGRIQIPASVLEVLPKDTTLDLLLRPRDIPWDGDVPKIILLDVHVKSSTSHRQGMLKQFCNHSSIQHPSFTICNSFSHFVDQCQCKMWYGEDQNQIFLIPPTKPYGHHCCSFHSNPKALRKE